MSQTIQRIDNLGRREATTLATATTQKVFASLSTSAPTSRQAISINNCDTAADLYVVITTQAASAPTISATNNDIIIPAKTDRQFQIGIGCALWVRHSGAGTINYTATELL
jgi:hypothetical protein